MIDVENNGAHTDTIGVYVDVTAPAPGCGPNGRVAQTTVTLAAGGKTTVSVPVNYSCSPSVPNGGSYIWVAVADHGADDLAACGPGNLQNAACNNGLVNDDSSGPADNIKRVDAPVVVAR